MTDPLTPLKTALMDLYEHPFRAAESGELSGTARIAFTMGVHAACRYIQAATLPPHDGRRDDVHDQGRVYTESGHAIRDGHIGVVGNGNRHVSRRGIN